MASRHTSGLLPGAPWSRGLALRQRHWEPSNRAGRQARKTRWGRPVEATGQPGQRGRQRRAEGREQQAWGSPAHSGLCRFRTWTRGPGGCLVPPRGGHSPPSWPEDRGCCPQVQGLGTGPQGGGRERWGGGTCAGLRQGSGCLGPSQLGGPGQGTSRPWTLGAQHRRRPSCSGHGAPGRGDSPRGLLCAQASCRGSRGPEAAVQWLDSAPAAQGGQLLPHTTPQPSLLPEPTPAPGAPTPPAGH